MNKNYFFTLFKYEKEVKTRLAGQLLDTIKREVHDKLGYTMRLNSISAAIGRVQLKKLNKFNDRRRKIMNL